VLKSTRVVVPTVVGWLKPVILLPAAVIARLPNDQLEMVIAHELGHIRRYDYLFNLLQLLIETLFFYHPAIRWMSGQVRQEREHCCDDLVLAHCDKPVLYARALANLEVLREPLPAVALAATGGDLVYRVRRIVQHELPGHNSGFAQLAVMLGVAVMVSVGAHQGFQVRQQFLESGDASRQVLPALHGQVTADRTAWVQGIVAYPRLAAEKIKAIRAEDQAQLALIVEQRKAAQRPQLAASRLNAQINAPSTRSDEDTLPKEAHDLFTLAPRDETRLDEESMLLAGIYSPPASGVTAEEQERKAKLENFTEFKLTAETMVAPVYPFKARRKRLDGYVRLEFSVNGDGKPLNIRVVEAQPEDIFEKSAISALQQWVFRVGEEHPEDLRLLQVFDFGMEAETPELFKRDRRCEIAGSRICGTQRYNEKNKIN
jgi:TonB family protein